MFCNLIVIKLLPMIHYDFDKRRQVLNCTMVGTITVDEVVVFIESIIKADYLLADLNMIIDMLDCEVLFQLNQLQKIADVNNRLLDRYLSVKHAIVLDKPLDTAMAYYYKQLSMQGNYMLELFTTIEAANKWMGVSELSSG